MSCKGKNTAIHGLILIFDKQMDVDLYSNILAFPDITVHVALYFLQKDFAAAGSAVGSWAGSN
jgi:hypothetical protein